MQGSVLQVMICIRVGIIGLKGVVSQKGACELTKLLANLHCNHHLRPCLFDDIVCRLFMELFGQAVGRKRKKQDKNAIIFFNFGPVMASILKK